MSVSMFFQLLYLSLCLCVFGLGPHFKEEEEIFKEILFSFTPNHNCNPNSDSLTTERTPTPNEWRENYLHGIDSPICTIPKVIGCPKEDDFTSNFTSFPVVLVGCSDNSLIREATSRGRKESYLIFNLTLLQILFYVNLDTPPSSSLLLIHSVTTSAKQHSKTI
jgi:hypothetical protein